MGIFFTADAHFNHKNIIKYCNRPFSSVDQMNEVMINNWNAKVSKSDDVYVVGDFGFGDCTEIFRSLNGTKFLIIGSHDKGCMRLHWQFTRQVHGLDIGNNYIWLNHYAQRVWPRSHYGTWHLFGHSHGKMEPWGNSFDVGVDVWNFTPLALEEVEEEIKSLQLFTHREVRS